MRVGVVSHGDKRGHRLVELSPVEARILTNVLWWRSRNMVRDEESIVTCLVKQLEQIDEEIKHGRYRDLEESM